MKYRSTIAALLLTLATASAGAQDLETYQQRQRDLVSLAELFGELHHLRRTCEPRMEADVWRDRMKQLMTLEEPQDAEREQMVGKFNAGYQGAQSRYPVCDRRARDYAAGRASQGDVIVRRLSDALLAGADNDSGPKLVVGPAVD